MLNVPELERRWKRYNKKRRTPLYLTGAMLFVAAGTAAYLAFSGIPEGPGKRFSDLVRTAENSVRSLVATTPTEPARTAVAAAEMPEEKTDALKLAPSMEFMQDFETDDMDYYLPSQRAPKPQKAPAPVAKPQPPQLPQPAQPERLPSQIPVRETRLPAISSPETTVHTPEPVLKAQPREVARSSSAPKKMLIQREQNMKDIQDVIARFKKNKNPALSLFVAKRYYAIGNYQQAYNYALITNDLDQRIEDSWLIFSKSLYKLDQQKLALKTLKAYEQESGSVKAKITIEQMENGTFK